MTVQNVEFSGNAGNDITEWPNRRSCRCTIISHNEVFYSRSFICNDYIHTVANNHLCFDNISWGVRQIAQTDYDTQSGEVRSFLLEQLQRIFPGTPLQTAKHASGFPVLLHKNAAMPVALSFTHDEQFVAFSFSLPTGMSAARLPLS